MKITDLAEKFIWSLYSAVALTVFWIVAMTVSKGRHMSPGAGAAVGGILFAAVLLFAFLFRRVVIHRKNADFQGSVFLPKLLEYLIFVAGLAGVVYIRFYLAGSLERNQVFETVMVNSDTFRLTVAHNGYRLYLNVLHEALILMGNKLFAALILQIVLQVAGIFFLYFAVRRLSGAPAAMVTMAFMGFSPYIFMETMHFSVFWFLLFFFSVALWNISCLKETMESFRANGRLPFLIIDCIMTGLWIGFCCYLDVTGLLLLLFLTGVIWFSDYRNRRFTAWVSSLISAFVGFVFFIDLVPGGTENVTSTIRAHLKLIRFRGLTLTGNMQQSLFSWDMMVLAVLLALGIIGYFFRSEMLDRGMWFLAFVLLLVMQCFGVCSNDPVNTYGLIYLFCAAMAGCSVTDIFYFKERKRKVTADNVDTEQTEEFAMDAGPQGNAAAGADGGSASTDAASDVEFIENPLPVPPKHVKKLMDYDYPVADDDDFDIQ